jgi:hypothetical protein
VPDATISSRSIALFSASARPCAPFSVAGAPNPDFKACICAYDIKTDSPDAQVRTAKRADYALTNAFAASTAAEAVTGAEAVFAVVNAERAYEAAMAALPAS